MNESCLEIILNYDAFMIKIISLERLEGWSSMISFRVNILRYVNVLTAWNFCLLCWAVDGLDEVMLNPVEGKEVTAMTGWLIT